MVLCFVIAGVGMIYGLGLIRQQTKIKAVSAGALSKQVETAPPPTNRKSEVVFMKRSQVAADFGQALTDQKALNQDTTPLSTAGALSDSAGRAVTTGENVVARYLKPGQAATDEPRFMPTEKQRGLPTSVSEAAPVMARHGPDLRASSATAMRDRVGKQARITRLIARIHFSIDHGDNVRTLSLMNELANLKGSDNDYVLKLKAYWHMRNEKYGSAVTLLNEILARDANDLEAGINMAVAEMKTHQYQAARERLVNLRRVYPDNSLIQELLQRLR
jgi:predicted Zn-dependent protease